MKVEIIDEKGNTHPRRDSRDNNDPELAATAAGNNSSHSTINFTSCHTSAYIVNATKTGYLENMGSLKLVQSHTETLKITLKKFDSIPGYPVASIVAD